MRLVVKVGGKMALIVGYGPGEAGTPKAIVVMDGSLQAVALRDIELPKLPKRLRKALGVSASVPRSKPKAVS